MTNTGKLMKEKTLLLLLALFAFLVCFGDLPFYDLESGDDTRVAGISAEMALTGDWIVPRLDGTLFLEYPPLFYQIQGGCFRIFGMTPFAAHLPSAAAAFLAVFFLYVFLRSGSESQERSLAASLMLLLNIQILAACKEGTVDMMLLCFILLAWCGFSCLCRGNAGKKEKLMGFLLFWAGLSGGVMTKGPVGLAIPLSGIGIYTVLDDILQRKFRFGRYVFLLAGTLLSLVPLAVWSCLLYQAEGEKALKTVLITNSVGRFSSGKADHASPWYYYLLRLPSLFHPWILLVFGEIAVLFRNREKLKKNLFSLCALTVPFILLSIASGKRQLYLLPLAVPSAVLASHFLTEYLLPFFRNMELLKKRETLILRIFTAVPPVVSVVAGGLAFPVMKFKALIFPLLVLAGLVLTFFPKTRKAGVFSAALFFILSLTLAFYGQKTIRYSVAPLYEKCRELEQQGYKIVLAGFGERTRGAAVFYMRKKIPAFWRPPAKSPSGNEVWVVRDGENRFTEHVIRFSDDHKIVMPSGQKQLSPVK